MKAIIMNLVAVGVVACVAALAGWVLGVDPLGCAGVSATLAFWMFR